MVPAGRGRRKPADAGRRRASDSCRPRVFVRQLKTLQCLPRDMDSTDCVISAPRSPVVFEYCSWRLEADPGKESKSLLG
jgi:hypothetical protein